MGELVRYNEERKIPVVDSRLAAGVLGIEHNSLKNLIREYTADFESFGQLPLNKAVETGAPNPETFYLLNEEQTGASNRRRACSQDWHRQQ